jgi:L-amino acid N-acyltransferase YncA
MPDPDLIHVTPENVDEIGIHCVGSKEHPGRKPKIEWFKREYKRGLRILMLFSAKAGKSVGFIEYAPGESAWRAVNAPNYLVVHCIWVKSAGKGYGSKLINEVLVEAKNKRRHGVVVVTSTGTWCAKSAIFEKNGFKLVNKSEPFGLYVKKAKKSAEDPGFATTCPSKAKNLLVFRYSSQCPYVAKAVEELSAEAGARKVRLKLQEIKTPREARSAPTPYGVTSLEMGNKVLVDHAISRTRFRNILRQEGLIK